ncbi:hypothetical protein LSH36_356g06016 [Paralvinella palmiformis]|uniref:Syntaxin-18 n=1 Tax=Paralvinella palmiformis TaxID=53620 RepID=A0AAD9JEF0_9ANNE|nr:hypothetical protein LSH36_356g06016 [Paralvinella palmiformis]
MEPEDPEFQPQGYNHCTNLDQQHRRGIIPYTGSNISITVVGIPGDEKFQESLWAELKLKENDTLLTYTGPQDVHQKIMDISYHILECNQDRNKPPFDYGRVQLWRSISTGKIEQDQVTDITQLKEFLLEHRKDYINVGSYYGVEKSLMTDAERDQIDSEAETCIKLCSESVKTLKHSVPDGKWLPQIKQHRETVIRLIEAYLKVVCNIFSEQRAIRVKRVVDKRKLSRLEPESAPQKESFQDRIGKRERQNEPPLEGKRVAENGNTKKENNNYKPHLLFNEENILENMSPEEIQMFEHENQQLYNEMNNMVDEVKKIEGKVVEIAQLQEIFTEKVLEQDKDIDRIADTVVGATENIKEANEDIREALKNNAGLRVWILFFLIVLSCTLLFLDWYNP